MNDLAELRFEHARAEYMRVNNKACIERAAVRAATSLAAKIEAHRAHQEARKRARAAMLDAWDALPDIDYATAARLLEDQL